MRYKCRMQTSTQLQQKAVGQRAFLQKGRRAVVRVSAKKQDAGPPPAWPRRVVVPEVEPRTTPKVSSSSSS